MKKLLFLIIYILPLVGFSQQDMPKLITLPKLKLDSTTNLRTLRVTQTISGAKNDKLGALLAKWTSANFSVTGKTKAPDSTLAAINGEGNFSGSLAVSQPQHDVNSTNRVVTNTDPVSYKLTFNIKVIIEGESYIIVIDHLKLEYFNVNTAIEPYYNDNFPVVRVPNYETAEFTGLGEMYNNMFSDINTRLANIPKSASKYLTKAQKKGEL